VWHSRGIVFAKLCKHENAIECFDEALKINPNHEKAWYNKGFSFWELHKFEKAFECFDKVKEIESNDKIYKK